VSTGDRSAVLAECLLNSACVTTILKGYTAGNDAAFRPTDISSQRGDSQMANLLNKHLAMNGEHKRLLRPSLHGDPLEEPRGRTIANDDSPNASAVRPSDGTTVRGCIPRAFHAFDSSRQIGAPERRTRSSQQACDPVARIDIWAQRRQPA